MWNVIICVEEHYDFQLKACYSLHSEKFESKIHGILYEWNMRKLSKILLCDIFYVKFLFHPISLIARDQRPISCSIFDCNATTAFENC